MFNKDFFKTLETFNLHMSQQSDDIDLDKSNYGRFDNEIECFWIINFMSLFRAFGY